ncbi:MAG TPA: type I 3-dehydroquinate dehydratase [Mycobacteriales bacterium]|nr:type I 3-dehydroquinate dehydratase [Mycobacteriales bacterium]
MSVSVRTTVDDRSTPVPTASGSATVSVTLTRASQAAEPVLRALASRAGCLEVRADLVGDLDPDRLRRHFGGELLYSLRGAEQGGMFRGSLDERHARLLAAAGHYDLVDLEECDLVPELLGHIRPEARRISWHGPATDLAALRATLARLRVARARLYLVAPAITRAEQALVPLAFLKEVGRRDLTAFGTGAAGTWSRLLAPWLGAPVIYGRIDAGPDTGIPTVDQLVGDYGFPRLRPLRSLYGIIGRSVSRSLSPRLHNAGYRELDLPALYLPFQVEEFGPFWREVAERGLAALGIPLDGATVVAPHKETALRLAATRTVSARDSGSANSLVRSGRHWRAATSNSPAVVTALARAGVQVAHRRVAVVGCGGAGRAAAAALRQAGAEPTLVNRGSQRGRDAAALLGLPFVLLGDFDPAGFSVVVHATPLTQTVPFRVGDLPGDAAVLDMVYAPEDTALVTAARDRRLTVIDGWDVLLADASCQFRLMTGREMPASRARDLLREARSARRAGR